MNSLFVALRVFCTTLVILSFLAAGCGTKSSTDTPAVSPPIAGTVVNLNPATLLANIISGAQQTAARSLGGWDWGSFFSSFGNLLSSINYTLDFQKVTYQSIGADGQPHSMTGLLILPRRLIGSKPSVPILLYQHGTETYRPYSPSQFLSHLDRPADYPEVMVAAAIASTGYAVVMTDYEGLGDNTNTQPYVHGTSLARQVIDMLRSSRDIIAGSNAPCSWNSQLFLIGYSEGGYVTMTTTRELQLNHAAEFTVTASAPLSGPHDLSGEMRSLMLSNSTSKAPYFLPFLLSGYNYASQGALFNPVSSMVAPYNSTIPPLFSGTSPSNTISEAMGMVYNPVNLVIPRDLMASTFISLLSNQSSLEFAFLRQNNSFLNPADLTTWIPSIPIRMFHHRSDELVPYGNSQAAFNAFSSVGAKARSERGPGVSLIESPVFFNLPLADPVKTVHFGAAFPELSAGWNWLNGFKL